MLRAIGVLAAVTGLGAPALADDHRAAAPAIYLAEICTQMGDAAFEHSLQEDLDATDITVLIQVFSTATFECLGLSMEICEGQPESEACLADLGAWIAEARAVVVAGLPDAVEDVDEYEGAVALARSGPNEDDCSEMTEDERTRYCAVVAEGMALEDAYLAWRLARLSGAVDLVGHDPVDLEIIR